jgi:hypothetical protein
VIIFVYVMQISDVMCAEIFHIVSYLCFNPKLNYLIGDIYSAMSL